MNVTAIIDYENGELDALDTLHLFAELVRTGTAWQLQGSYGRAAAGLIKAGLLTPEGEVTPAGFHQATEVDESL